MKNTVYALARQDQIDHVETFALRLAEHFVAQPAVTARSHQRSSSSRGPALLRPAVRIRTRSFRQAREQWTAVVTRDAAGCRSCRASRILSC